jgi:hypothetical protein
MAFDTAQFRLNFPEFSDIVRYPDSQIDFWVSVGEICLIQPRWRELYDQGISLFVAHNVVLAAQNKAATDAGGAPGQGAGPKQSKSVGSASVSYNIQLIAETNAGEWNATNYGRQLIRLARMLGVGGHVV